jgi:hypothetical protein
MGGKINVKMTPNFLPHWFASREQFKHIPAIYVTNVYMSKRVIIVLFTYLILQCFRHYNTISFE